MKTLKTQYFASDMYKLLTQSMSVIFKASSQRQDWYNWPFEQHTWPFNPLSDDEKFKKIDSWLDATRPGFTIVLVVAVERVFFMSTIYTTAQHLKGQVM